MVNTLLPRRTVLLAALAIGMGGCFGASVVRYEMLPVEGTITFEGQPLANAEVMFDSADGPRGFGVTDETGRFTITTRQFGAGLPAGQYRVTVGGSEKTRIGGSGKPVEVAASYRESGVGRVTIDASSGPMTFDVKKKTAGREGEAGER